MSGKGSTPRPIPDRERYESEWDRIFRGRPYQISSTAGGYLDPENINAPVHPMPAQAGEVEGDASEAGR